MRPALLVFPFLVCTHVMFASMAFASGTRTTYPRTDGASVEALVYDSGARCSPLAIVSHGLGGSSEGNPQLAEALKAAGYRVVAPSHTESGPRLLLRAAMSPDKMVGIARAASDPAAHKARQMDFDAILAVEMRRCAVPHKLLAGHSMGARASLVEAGARNSAHVNGKDRFDAYIAISPQGEGNDFFPTGSIAEIKKPVMMITGTEDRSVDGGFETRMTAFQGLRPGKKRLAIIRGADHAELGGKGDGKVGRMVGVLAVEYGRAIIPGPWHSARYHDGVTIRDK